MKVLRPVNSLRFGTTGMVGYLRRIWEPSQHLSWLHLGREEVERALMWFETITGMFNFNFSKLCAAEGLLGYILPKATNQGKKIWHFLGQGLCILLALPPNSHSMYFFFFQRGVGRVEGLPLVYQEQFERRFYELYLLAPWLILSMVRTVEQCLLWFGCWGRWIAKLPDI